MKFRLLCLLILVFISTNLAAAADTNLDPWPVVKRCLPAPIVPDKNWSYDGEILMRGWAGIHGIRANSHAPYVAHWGRGLLSPNGQWLLTQDSTTYTEQLTGGGPMGRYTTEYGNIHAENLTTKQKITFPWEASYVLLSSIYLFGPADPFWLDNTHFLAFSGWGGHETKMGDLETGQVIDRPDIDLEDHEYSVSPDQTRAVSFGQLYDFSNQKLMSEEVGIDHDLQWTAWAHDSSLFFDRIPDRDRSNADMTVSNLTLFDRDGNIVAIPIRSGEQPIWPDTFSPKDDYFSFTEYVWRGDKQQPFIIDLRKKVIYDLCVDDAQGWAWSPDGTQFATILGQGQQAIVVVDMDDWQPYIVGYHTGSVLFWRSLS